MDWVTRIQKTLLILLILAQMDMFIGSLIDIDFGTCYVSSIQNNTYKNIDQIQRHAYGYTGWSLDTAKQNMHSTYVSSAISGKTKQILQYTVIIQ
jgi:hypothetical protein